MIKLCPEGKRLLECQGHGLLVGGPGSGKTTIALLKAVRRIDEGMQPGQSVLFLSFSRAAVARVAEAAKEGHARDSRDSLSMQTFHSFFWELLKTHGYLLGGPKNLRILMPHDEKARNGGLTERSAGWADWQPEREKLFMTEGLVAFDLFAPMARRLIERSGTIRRLIADRFPLVIVDEAQDTGEDAWAAMELLAPMVQMICLADIEQQIFDHLPGVGPERIEMIKRALDPTVATLAGQNHRSPDSEILKFADDVLADQPRGAPYSGVSALKYAPKQVNWHAQLGRAIAMVAAKAQKQTGERPRSIAILVSFNSTAVAMSKALLGQTSHGGKPIRHKLAHDEAEATLSARLGAFLLEPSNATSIEQRIAAALTLLADSVLASGTRRATAEGMREQAAKVLLGKPPRTDLVKGLRKVIHGISASPLRGDPFADLSMIKNGLRGSGCKDLSHVAEHLDSLISSKRGDRIQAGLAAEWLRDGAYTRARGVLDGALAQDQLLDSSEQVAGLHLMTIHKSKGKQFDGVVVVRETYIGKEGYSSSFVWRDDKEPYPKSRRILRVGITRAKSHAMILYPAYPACELLNRHRL